MKRTRVSSKVIVFVAAAIGFCILGTATSFAYPWPTPTPSCSQGWFNKIEQRIQGSSWVSEECGEDTQKWIVPGGKTVEFRITLNNPPGGPSNRLRWEIKKQPYGSLITLIRSGQGSSISAQAYGPNRYHVRFYCDANNNQQFDITPEEPNCGKMFYVSDCSEIVRGDWEGVGWTESDCYKYGSSWTEVVVEDLCGNKVEVRCAGGWGSRHYELWYVPKGGVGVQVGQCMYPSGANEMWVRWSAPSRSRIVGTKMKNDDPSSASYWLFEYDVLSGTKTCKQSINGAPPVVVTCPF